MRTLIFIATCTLCMSTALGEPVELESGETLDVQSARVEGSNVILQHPILGTLTVPIDKVRSINGAPPARPVATGAPAAADDTVKVATTPMPAKSDPKPVVEPLPSEWKGTFTLSGSFNEWTAQNTSLFTKLGFKRETDFEKTSLSMFYRFASKGGETNQSWYNFSANQLWHLKDSDWGIFANGQLDWSEFNSWEQRISGHGGLQFPLLEFTRKQNPALWIDSLKMHGRVGAGPRKEFAGVDRTLVLEGELGGIFTLDIAEGNELVANASYFPSITYAGVYRVDASLNWKMKLKGMDNLSLSLGLTYQFQSEVSSDDKNYDLLGTVGVALDF